MSEPLKLGRRYQLQLSGILYIGVTVVLGVGAINSQNNLLFIVFGIAMAALVFSGLLSGAMLMGISAERRLVGAAARGQSLRVTYTVRNANRFVPAFALTVSELRPRRQSRHHGDRTPVGGAAGGGGGQRWTRLISRPIAFVAQIAGRSECRIHATAEARHRGAATLEGIVVSSTFPFGVFRKSIRFRQRERLVVFPATCPLSSEILHTLSARGRLGDQSSAKRGRGNEFYGLRDYMPGDSPRLIAWKASARSENLVTRLTADHASSFVRILLLFDPDATAPRTKGGTKGDSNEDPNERAITLAASIIEHAIGRSIHVGLAVPQAGVQLEPGATQHHRVSMMEALARLDLHALTPQTAQAPPFGADGPNLVIAPEGRRHPMAPSGVVALGVDALPRWTIDPESRERGAGIHRGVA